ncbi:MAG: hypothetical protein ACXQTM_06715 [Methanosarcinales archaeon]
MLRVRKIVEALRIFERSKVPFEVKILGIATYIQTSSVIILLQGLSSKKC